MKNLKIIALVLLVTLALTGCGGSNKETEVSLEDAKANVVKLISETKFDELTEEERNAVSDIQKEYMAKIEKAKTLKEAEKLAKAYEKEIKDAVADKSNTSSKTSNTSTSNKNTSTSTSKKNGSSSTSSSSSTSTSKPSNSGPSSSGSSSNRGSTSNSGSSNTSGSGNNAANSQPKERTVTIKAPIYGPQYTNYWIKDGYTNELLFETKDPVAYDNKCLEYASVGRNINYGSGGKSDIIGYETYVLTESEFNQTNWSKNPSAYPEVTITWND